MVFAHGFGCDQQMWRWVTPAFEDDYRLVLFDPVGAGHSDLSAYDPRKYGTLAGYTTDLLKICHELALHDVAFVGPSPRYIDDGDYQGGFSRADIDQLLAILDSNHLGWAAAMAPVIMGQQPTPDLAQDLNNSFCRTDPAIARDFARVTFLSDNRADLPQVQDLMTVPGRVYCETHVQPLLRLQGQVKEISCDLQRPSRDPVPVLLHGAEVRDEAGQVKSIRFAFSDVTDRRRFEFELRCARQHAEHIKAIVDASADAIFSLSAAGLVQSWNAAAERLSGHAASWALGRHVSELIVVDDPAASVALALVKLRQGQAVHRETVCTRPDGQRLTVSISLSPHVLPPQALVGVSVIVRDMTEQARARACLRDSEEQFRTIFDFSPAGVVLIDPVAGTILECNEEAAQSCGDARHEFVGRPVRDVVAPAYRLQSTARRDRILVRVLQRRGPQDPELVRCRSDH